MRSAARVLAWVLMITGLLIGISWSIGLFLDWSEEAPSQKILVSAAALVGVELVLFAAAAKLLAWARVNAPVAETGSRKKVLKTGVAFTLIYGLSVFALTAAIPHAIRFPAGTGSQAADTDFVVSRCKERADVPGTSFQSGVRSTEWTDDGLRITAGVATNCEAPFSYGGYKLAGNDLTLEYGIAWGPMRAACTCGYELKYRIKGLKKQDYSISIKEL